MQFFSNILNFITIFLLSIFYTGTILLLTVEEDFMRRTFTKPYASLYEEYLEYERPGMSMQGYKSLEGRTRRFLCWLEEKQLRPQDVCITQAMEFRNDIAGKKNVNGELISQGTICNYIKTARRFYRYLLEKETVRTNPFKEVAYPRIPSHISRNVLTENQMARLLERLKRFNSGSTKKEKARLYVCHVLSEFMYSTGLRIDEAASLEPSDVNFKLRHVYVRQGKGGKSRTAFMSEYASEVLELYLRKGKIIADRILYGGKRRTVFSGKTGSLMQMLNRRLRAICIELDIPVITSHGFRHSLGTHLLRGGCDMRHIQVILGHDKLSSTQIYTKVYADDLKESLDRYHPRQWTRTMETDYEK